MRVLLLAHSLLACWQPSLLGLCPILEHFAYWGFSFLVSGAPPKKRGRSYGGLGDWGSRICWQNSGLSCFEKRGDGGVVGIDNFNSYYEISLKTSAGQQPLAKHRIFCD